MFFLSLIVNIKNYIRKVSLVFHILVWNFKVHVKNYSIDFKNVLTVVIVFYKLSFTIFVHSDDPGQDIRTKLWYHGFVDGSRHAYVQIFNSIRQL